MRLLPPFVICLALLPGCKTDPIDPDGGEVIAELVDEDQFAKTAAETVCAQLFACECGDLPFTSEAEPLPWASEAECVAEKQPEFESFLADVLSTGATYSPECGGEYIANFLRPDCQTLWDFSVVDGGRLVDTQVCPLAVNERAVGQGCEPFSTYVNDCGEGKLCTYENYTCVEIGELPVQEGNRCQIGWVDLPCESGTVCAYDSEYQDNICQKPSKEGETCRDYQCPGADLTCDYETNICRANAVEGESCEQVSCAAGLYCDGGLDFTCVAQYDYGHGCANASVCAHGAECINNICTPPPPAVCNLSW